MKRLLSLALLCVLLASCTGGASSAEVEKLRKDVEALKAATTAVPTPQPILVVNKDTKPIPGRFDVLPYCVTYSVAGVAQERCRDTWTPGGPNLAPELQQQSAAVRACWNPIRVGDPLPDCWR